MLTHHLQHLVTGEDTGIVNTGFLADVYDAEIGFVYNAKQEFSPDKGQIPTDRKTQNLESIKSESNLDAKDSKGMLNSNATE